MSTATTNLGLILPVGEEDINLLDINTNSSTIDTAFSRNHVQVSASSVSALPKDFANSKITANHRVVSMYLSNTAAQPSDWDYTTSAGNVRITGTISGTTDITLQLAEFY